MGLNCGNLSEYNPSNCSFLSAVIGNGCKSSNSVGGKFFSGKIKCLKDTGSCVSAPIHLSDTILKKYWGGSGSKMGTKNLTECSSWQYFALSKKYSWWRMTSESTSSTRIQKASEAPCNFSSHWKSGVMVSSTFNIDLVMGWMWVDNSSFGNWWTYLWMVLPSLGTRTSSPISFGPKSYNLKLILIFLHPT